MRCSDKGPMANSNMADINDVELVAELNSYGKNVSLPIKAKNRPILIKLLNHLRVGNKKEDLTSRKSSAKPASSRNSRGPPTPTPSTSHSPSRYRPNTRSHDRPSNLEALSSDDSDVDVSISESPMPSTSTNSKPHSSSYTDSVLRTLRRRATDTPSPALRSSRRSEVLELSTEDERGSGNDERSSAPSPSRSKLYPDLSRFSSSLHNSNTDNFESSDSDGDMSTYSVENKSINTSFPSIHDNRNHRDSSTFGTPSNNVSPSYQSSLPYHRSMYTRRYQMNGPGSSSLRVQQYRSRFSEHLPLLLIAFVVLFFFGLSVTYVVKHKDFIFSWLSTSSSLGSDNKFLLCKDESQISKEQNCFTQGEINKAMEYITDIYQQLSAKKGAVICKQGKDGDDVMKASVLRASIEGDSVASTTADRTYRCCILHVLANPHWGLMPLKSDGSEATAPDDVIKLESSVAAMGFWCRLHRSFTQVVYGIVYISLAIICAVVFYMYLKYHMKQRGQEQKDVYAMVERIIDVLKGHHEQFRKEDTDDSPYLAVQHVRDQLLPPAQRRQYQHIWDKAVEFIAANESRIRLESKIIRGEQFDVWYWLQPSLHNGKVWQGQAFGENDNNSNQVIYCPSPCLKIRNMFDSNVENDEDNWEEGVTDAVLEKCRSIGTIVHIFVDVNSKEGCVYMKCSSCEDAGKARSALNGWWFDGRLVTVKHLKTDHYHKRWPESRNATIPLKPSTNQMRSLSQPFYRSSLEMT